MRALAITLFVFGLWSCAYSGSQVDDQYREFILNWQAPWEVQKQFPYFLSGLDKEGAPVWIFPLGHWDIRGYLDEHKHKGNAAETLRRHSEQMFTRFHESPVLYGAHRNPWDGYVLIADLDQYSLRSATHLGSLRAVVDTAFQFTKLNNQERRIKRVYVVNANIVFRTVYQFLRPILGRLGNIIELHGTNKAKWVPKLLRQIPQDQLPARLGGSPWHTSLQVFG